MRQIRLILVGGFLGAGKTTLLAQAAKRLQRQGKRVGLVTNDQAPNLVDTAILTQEALPVSEVSGGCFCCHFDELVSASERLVAEYETDVILAEPVGSCTDLSATVLQPLKKFFANRFRLAPLSVLVDPLRLRESVQSDRKRTLPESVFYIFAKQLEEADLIVVNKADAVYPCEMTQLENILWEYFPNKPVLGISALRGKGVDAWLNFVMQDRPTGQRIAEVDYDIYAHGEAVLGWLNAKAEMRTNQPIDWNGLCDRLMRAFQRELSQRSAEVAHVKLRLATGKQSLTANLTTTAGTPTVRGNIETSQGTAELVFNARVRLEPDDLCTAFQSCLDAMAADGVKAELIEIESFAPARPRPTHRFDFVVLSE